MVRVEVVEGSRAITNGLEPCGNMQCQVLLERRPASRIAFGGLLGKAVYELCGCRHTHTPCSPWW